MSRSPGVTPSSTHLVLIPTYNAGPKVLETVQEALRYWAPVWVVVDGSTDGTGPQLQALARSEPQLKVMVLERNQGKGAAVMQGLAAAEATGYTYALTMDSDGQHPRRKVSNAWANLETLWMGIGDSLYGFRVYPVAPLLRIMERQRWMRRFDFDIEAAVRLCWRGVWPVNLDAPVKYLRQEEGGVSHFNYLRDNALLTWMHTRLMLGFLLRLPVLLLRRMTGRRA